MRMKKCSMSCTCHAKRRSRPQNVLKVARLPHRIDIAQKTRTKKRAKRALRKRDLRGHHFVREFRRKRKMKELLCSKMAHTYDTTSNEHRALTPTVRKMIFQHHQSIERTLYSSHKTSLQFKTTCRQTIGPSEPSNNAGLWILLLHNFSFGFLNFVLSHPDPFHVCDDESKTVDWVLNAICKRLQKDQPWLRGLLTKSQSNPLATQITAIVLPCFRLL